MPSDRPLLRLLEVTKTYESPESSPALMVLNSISLEMEEGESVAIVGPSGSGKSTLLHLVGGLDRPTSGSILFRGTDLSNFHNDQLAAIRNKEMGFVFQSHYLLPQCSVIENVLVPTLPKPPAQVLPGRSVKADAEPPLERGNRLLKRVGLGHRVSHRPGQLSGGERQRVAVVRALINRPAVLLADEPTGALDHAAALGLGELLLELNREEGVALVVVTHSLELASKMGRVLSLKDGRLDQDSPGTRTEGDARVTV